MQPGSGMVGMRLSITLVGQLFHQVFTFALNPIISFYIYFYDTWFIPSPMDKMLKFMFLNNNLSLFKFYKAFILKDLFIGDIL